MLQMVIFALRAAIFLIARPNKQRSEYGIVLFSFVLIFRIGANGQQIFNPENSGLSMIDNNGNNKTEEKIIVFNQ